jgi:hypothetical protein
MGIVVLREKQARKSYIMSNKPLFTYVEPQIIAHRIEQGHCSETGRTRGNVSGSLTVPALYDV